MTSYTYQLTVSEMQIEILISQIEKLLNEGDNAKIFDACVDLYAADADNEIVNSQATRQRQNQYSYGMKCMRDNWI